jgi:hypothetical protein
MRITIESEETAGGRPSVATTTPTETSATVINAGPPRPALLQSLAPNMDQYQASSDSAMDAGPPPETLVKAIERVASASAPGSRTTRIDAGSAPTF